jgi:hypothetical protein
LIQLLVRACRGRPRISQIVISALKLTADAATLLRANHVERGLYSAFFNLQYYNGLFDELDDVHFLFKDLENPI